MKPEDRGAIVKKTETELLSDQWDVEHMQTDPDAIEQLVLYDVDPDRHLATITFNNPEQMNALPLAALERVGDLVREAEVDDRVKVILFKGEGPCFGTGADARELGHYIGYKKGDSKEARKRPAQHNRMLPDRNLLSRAFQKPIDECLKATVCQVHSYCYGGHLQIAMAADIVIATPDARFTHPAIRYLGAGPQDLWNWIENLGMKRMKDVMLSMRPLTAEEGEQCGFIAKVVEYDEIDRWVADYVQAISVMPLDSLMMGKAMMQFVLEARGRSLGSLTGWVGHGWTTNVVFEEGEWNFLRARRDKGLAGALREREEMVAPYFRLGTSAGGA